MAKAPETRGYTDVRRSNAPMVDYPVPTGPQPPTQYYGGNTYGQLGPIGQDPRHIGSVSAHNDPYHSTMSAVSVNGSVSPVISYYSRDPHVLWAPSVPDPMLLLDKFMSMGRAADPRFAAALGNVARDMGKPIKGSGSATASPSGSNRTGGGSAAGSPPPAGSISVSFPNRDKEDQKPQTPEPASSHEPEDDGPAIRTEFTDVGEGAEPAFTISGIPNTFDGSGLLRVKRKGDEYAPEIDLAPGVTVELPNDDGYVSGAIKLLTDIFTGDNKPSSTLAEASTTADAPSVSGKLSPAAPAPQQAPAPRQAPAAPAAPAPRQAPAAPAPRQAPAAPAPRQAPAAPAAPAPRQATAAPTRISTQSNGDPRYRNYDVTKDPRYGRLAAFARGIFTPSDVSDAASGGTPWWLSGYDMTKDPRYDRMIKSARSLWDLISSYYTSNIGARPAQAATRTGMAPLTYGRWIESQGIGRNSNRTSSPSSLRHKTTGK